MSNELPFTAELTDRLNAAHTSLSPAVESVVISALDWRSQSLSLALVRTVATASSGGRREADSGSGPSPSSDSPPSSSQPSRSTLLEVSTALVSLGGYVRLRIDVLGPETDVTPAERDISILASDYLHASAHAALASAPVDTDRHVDLYRTLTNSSTALATRFLSEGDESETPADDSVGRGVTPTAILMGTACALGSACAGAPRETTEAMRIYGESLGSAIALVDVDVDEQSDQRIGQHSTTTPILEAVERVLAGDTDSTLRSDSDPDEEPRPNPGSDRHRIRAHLEDARQSLGLLPESDARTRLEAATSVPLEAIPP